MSWLIAKKRKHSELKHALSEQRNLLVIFCNLSLWAGNVLSTLHSFLLFIMWNGFYYPILQMTKMRLEVYHFHKKISLLLLQEHVVSAIVGIWTQVCLPPNSMSLLLYPYSFMEVKHTVWAILCLLVFLQGKNKQIWPIENMQNVGLVK